MGNSRFLPRVIFGFSSLSRTSSSVIQILPKCKCHQQNQDVHQRTFFSMPGAGSGKRRQYAGRQLVGYTMDQMFDVVSDVGNYYKFVPWCKKSVVLQKRPGHLVGDLIIGFPPIHESYTSSVTLVRPHLVKAECTEGRIFNQMLTLWRFSPGLKRETQSCVVDFQIVFEFRSVLHRQLSNLFFDQVAKQMEGAFLIEVGRRYGPPKLKPKNLLST